MTRTMKRQWDLLLVVTNDRYGSEQFGTVRRMIDAALRSGHSIQVWACGISNMLTERAAGPGGSCATDSCCSDDQPSADCCVAVPTEADCCVAVPTTTDTTTDCCPTDQVTTDCCPSSQPSTAELIADLVSRYPDRFSWVACQTCGSDRGAEHVPGVLTEPGFGNFREFVDGAAKTVYIGGV